jgi:hypothetical protein
LETKLKTLHLLASNYADSGKQKEREAMAALGTDIAKRVNDVDLKISQRMLEIDVINETGKGDSEAKEERQLDLQTAKQFGENSERALRTADFYLAAREPANRGDYELALITKRLGKTLDADFGPQHWSLLFYRANTLWRSRQFVSAEKELHRLNALTTRLYGEGSRQMVSVLNLSASLDTSQQNYGDAQKKLVELQRILRTLYPPSFPIHAMAMINQAELEISMTQFTTAEQTARTALALAESSWGKTHRNLVVFRVALAEALIRQGKDLPEAYALVKPYATLSELEMTELSLRANQLLVLALFKSQRHNDAIEKQTQLESYIAANPISKSLQAQYARRLEIQNKQTTPHKNAQ